MAFFVVHFPCFTPVARSAVQPMYRGKPLIPRLSIYLLYSAKNVDALAWEGCAHASLPCRQNWQYGTSSPNRYNSDYRSDKQVDVGFTLKECDLRNNPRRQRRFATFAR